MFLTVFIKFSESTTDRMSSGGVFQTAGPEYENERLANVVEGLYSYRSLRLSCYLPHSYSI